MWWTAVFQPEWTVSVLPRQNISLWGSAVEVTDGWLVARDPVDLILSVRRVTDAPLQTLPYLAEERSVDEYSGLWTEARQRAVVSGSMPYHQKKGTRSALARAFSSQGYAVKIIEWFENSPRRQPYTFRVRITVGAEDAWLTPDRVAAYRLANIAKNAHTKIEAVDIYRPAGPATAYVGGITRKRRSLRVSQTPVLSGLSATANAYIGAAMRRVRRILIPPYSGAHYD